jgi:hypothetical protein
MKGRCYIADTHAWPFCPRPSGHRNFVTKKCGNYSVMLSAAGISPVEYSGSTLPHKAHPSNAHLVNIQRRKQVARVPPPAQTELA